MKNQNTSPNLTDEEFNYLELCLEIYRYVRDSNGSLTRVRETHSRPIVDALVALNDDLRKRARDACLPAGRPARGNQPPPSAAPVVPVPQETVFEANHFYAPTGYQEAAHYYVTEPQETFRAHAAYPVAHAPAIASVPDRYPALTYNNQENAHVFSRQAIGYTEPNTVYNEGDPLTVTRYGVDDSMDYSG